MRQRRYSTGGTDGGTTISPGVDGNFGDNAGKTAQNLRDLINQKLQEEENNNSGGTQDIKSQQPGMPGSTPPPPPPSNPGTPGDSGDSGSGDEDLDTININLPDGKIKVIDISKGSTNVGLGEVERIVEGLTERYADAESEERKDIKTTIDGIQEKLDVIQDQNQKMSDHYLDEMELNVAKLEDLADRYEEAETDEEKALIEQESESANKEYEKTKKNLANFQAQTDKFDKDFTVELAEIEKGEDDGESALEKASKWALIGGLTLTGIGQGVDLWDKLTGDDDDIPNVDIGQQMDSYIDAIQRNMPQILETQEQFQGDATRIGQENKYTDTFGGDPLTGMYDEFNTPGADGVGELDELYEQSKMQPGPDGELGTEDDIEIPKDQWLKQYIKDNPNTDVAIAYNDKISRVGQEDKFLTSKMDTAGKLFQSVEDGGYGFSQDQFRSPRQRRVLNLADDLMSSPVNKMVEDSVMSQLGKGGDMGDEYYNAQRDKFLGGLAPSLAKQGALMSGGAQRFARQMTGDYEKTLMNRQNQGMNYLSNRGNQLTGVSNLVNANTVNPMSLVGLNSGSGQQVYGQAGNASTNFFADPTTANAGASNQQSYLSNMMGWLNQGSTGQSIADFGSSLIDLGTTGKLIQSELEEDD